MAAARIGDLHLITLPGVQEDARRYLSEENVVVVTLLPETPVGQ